MPTVPKTMAAISNGSKIGAASPTPAITRPADINVVSTPSVILIPRLYFLYTAFLASLSFFNIVFLFQKSFVNDNFAHLQ